MTISDEAVEAAAKAHYDSSPIYRAQWVQLSAGHKRELVAPFRVALEAAAPFIRARALEDAANGFDKAHKMVRSNTYVESGIYHDLVQQARGLEIAAETLRARAAAERGQG